MHCASVLKKRSSSWLSGLATEPPGVVMLMMRLFILLLCSVLAQASAGTQLDDWHVMKLRLNSPLVGGRWYASTSPLSRGLGLSRGYVALYTASVIPGQLYTLQLSVPKKLKHVHVFLYDRWPLLTDTRQFPLPVGPVVIGLHARRITYRWQIGISSRSVSNLLYILVQYPREPKKRHAFAPRLELITPPVESIHTTGHGVTYLQGPRELMLFGSSPQTSYLLRPEVTSSYADAPSDRILPGDLISNGRFYSGLKSWVPVIVRKRSGNTPSVGRQGLHLPSGIGVRQQLDADVAEAHALLLWIDLRLTSPEGERLSLRNSPRLDIEVCYRDNRDRRHCGEQAKHFELYAGKRQKVLVREPSNSTRHQTAEHWRHYVFNLSLNKPLPKYIDSIILLNTGRRGAVWVRQIHLFSRSDDHELR